MSCKDFEQNLTLYVYEELSGQERTALETHLTTCEHCRKAVQDSQSLKRLLSERAVTEPSPELLARCRMDLDDALDRERLGWRSLLRDWLPPFAVAHPTRAVSTLALIAFGFSLGWILRPRAGEVVAPRTSSPSPSTASMVPTDLGNARINSISQVAPDPQTGAVRITLNAERRVTMEGSLDDPHIRQVLVDAVKSYDNPGIRLDTLDVLRQGANDPSVQEALLYALAHDPNAGVRLEALKSVRKMGWSPEVRKSLVMVVERDANPGVRDGAVDELVSRAIAGADQELVPVFRHLAVSDSDSYVRMKSLTALHQLGIEPSGALASGSEQFRFFGTDTVADGTY